MQGMPLKIDKKVLVGHELEIDELREKIGKFSLKNNPKLPEYTRLVSSSETDWDWDQVKGSHTVQALCNYMVIKTNSMNSRCLCR